jgi:hypothetical protein
MHGDFAGDYRATGTAVGRQRGIAQVGFPVILGHIGERVGGLAPGHQVEQTVFGCSCCPSSGSAGVQEATSVGPVVVTGQVVLT